MNLRLLITEECNRACAGCCNNDFDLKNLPIVNMFKGYAKIIITGGEPMLYPNRVKQVIKEIRYQNPTAKIIMYTAKSKRASSLVDMLELLDGITLTLHEQYDFFPFITLYNMINDRQLTYKMLRLNVFSNVDILPNIYEFKNWKIKDNIEWIKDCPLPINEVLMRL